MIQIQMDELGPAVYENIKADKAMIKRLADEFYLPANKRLLSVIDQQKGKLKIALSISGTTLELFENYRWDVIESFNELMQTGCVEMMGETYFNSYSSLYSATEFERQVARHSDLVHETFYVRPRVFLNTDLLYNDSIAAQVERMGFKGILGKASEPATSVSANKLYRVPGLNKVKLLLQNETISEIIAVHDWEENALRLDDLEGSKAQVVNISIEYGSADDVVKNDNVLRFLGNLTTLIDNNEQWSFKTPSEVLAAEEAKQIYSVTKSNFCTHPLRINYQWQGSSRLLNLLKRLYNLEHLVKQCNDRRLLKAWGRMQDASYTQSLLNENNSSQSAAFKQYERMVAFIEQQVKIKSNVQTTEHYSTPAMATI